MKNILIVINIVLLTLIAFIGVEIMYKNIEFSIAGNSINLKKKTSNNKKEIKQIMSIKRDYNKIIEKNILKVIADRKDVGLRNIEKEMEDVANLKATSLKLKLSGTIAGDNLEGVYAVIEDKRKNKQALYQVGQSVQGAKITKILRQKVVLNYNGEDQVLEMDFLSDSRVSENQNTVAPKVIQQSSAPKFVNLTRSIIDDSIKDINELMKQARIKPHFNNGNPDGLLLFGIKPKSLFAMMQLKNGDIIKGINGEKLQSVDDALKLYQSLKTSFDVNLQIKRQGRVEEITYHVR
jgi:general secretion pathway protein C